MPFPQAKDLGQPSREALWRSGTQISNHRRLLRARRERPRGGAAEQCHEVAPLHRAHPDPRIMGSIAAGQNRASQQKRPAHVRFGVAGSTGQCNTARSLSAGLSKPKVFRGR